MIKFAVLAFVFTLCIFALFCVAQQESPNFDALNRLFQRPKINNRLQSINLLHDDMILKQSKSSNNVPLPPQKKLSRFRRFMEKLKEYGARYSKIRSGKEQ
jgi:hypothetical protein